MQISNYDLELVLSKDKKQVINNLTKSIVRNRATSNTFTINSQYQDIKNLKQNSKISLVYLESFSILLAKIQEKGDNSLVFLPLILYASTHRLNETLLNYLRTEIYDSRYNYLWKQFQFKLKFQMNEKAHAELKYQCPIDRMNFKYDMIYKSIFDKRNGNQHDIIKLVFMAPKDSICFHLYDIDQDYELDHIFSKVYNHAKENLYGTLSSKNKTPKRFSAVVTFSKQQDQEQGINRQPYLRQNGLKRRNSFYEFLNNMKQQEQSVHTKDLHHIFYKRLESMIRVHDINNNGLIKQYGYKLVLQRDVEGIYLMEVYIPILLKEFGESMKRGFRKKIKERKEEHDAFGTDSSMQDFDLSDMSEHDQQARKLDNERYQTMFIQDRKRILNNIETQKRVQQQPTVINRGIRKQISRFSRQVSDLSNKNSRHSSQKTNNQKGEIKKLLSMNAYFRQQKVTQTFSSYNLVEEALEMNQISQVVNGDEFREDYDDHNFYKMLQKDFKVDNLLQDVQGYKRNKNGINNKRIAPHYDSNDVDSIIQSYNETVSSAILESDNGLETEQDNESSSQQLMSQFSVRDFDIMAYNYMSDSETPRKKKKLPVKIVSKTNNNLQKKPQKSNKYLQSPILSQIQSEKESQNRNIEAFDTPVLINQQFSKFFVKRMNLTNIDLIHLVEHENQVEEMFEKIKTNNTHAFIQLLKSYYQPLDQVMDRNGNTLINMATQMANVRIIDFLLQRGANPNISNEEGNTPLHYAVQMKFKKCADKLMKADASETIKNRRGYTVWEGL